MRVCELRRPVEGGQQARVQVLRLVRGHEGEEDVIDRCFKRIDLYISINEQLPVMCKTHEAKQ